MLQDRAYKLLAIQENISNSMAKELIDSGLVSAKGQKITLARTMMSANTKFSIQKTQKASVIFEDENLIAINKPPFMSSEKVSEIFKFPLLNRLDKETSGVLILYKNSEFQQVAIEEFKKNRVKKVYLSIVKGVLVDELDINLPISVHKTKGSAYAKIDLKGGKTAITRVFPLMVEAKKTLVKVEIDTGRTHQIRLHLANANFPVVGDEKYGKNSSKRMYLHSYKIELLGYKFVANLGLDFNNFGFEISKNFEI